MKLVNFKSKKRWKIINVFSFVFLLFFFCFQCGFEQIYAEEREVKHKNIKESQLYAESAVLMDAESGRVLYGKNMDKIMPMASTTKILTCIIALENCELDEIVTVSKYASKMPDVQLHIKEGEKYFLRDLLHSLMLESHNDVAVAIAEHVSGTVEEFANLMNKKAKEIGCQNSCFITANGLDATATKNDAYGKETEVFHSTTARDLACIMSYCILKSEKSDLFLEITAKNTHEFCDFSGKRKFSCRNHNALLIRMKDAISGKTGFTGKAGYCYVGAVKNNDRYYVVSLLACGWPYNKHYKWKDCDVLFRYGKEYYKKTEADLSETDISIPLKIQVTNGQFPLNVKAEEQSINLKIKEGEKIPSALLKEDENWNIETQIPEVLEAPVLDGKTVGTISFSINHDYEQIIHLVADGTVAKNNYKFNLKEIFMRVINSVYIKK